MKFVFLLLCLTIGIVINETRPFDREISKQYYELEQKGTLQNSECLHKVLDYVRTGCRTVNDSIQVDLANFDQLCMGKMTDGALAVYTELLTKAQNMCYFQPAQGRQAKADRTVSSRDLIELKQQGETLTLGTGLAATSNGSQQMLDKMTEDLQTSAAQHQTVLAVKFTFFMGGSSDVTPLLIVLSSTVVSWLSSWLVLQ